MNKEAYAQGFMAKSSALGVEPEELIKAAGPVRIGGKLYPSAAAAISATRRTRAARPRYVRPQAAPAPRTVKPPAAPVVAKPVAAGPAPSAAKPSSFDTEMAAFKKNYAAGNKTPQLAARQGRMATAPKL